MIIAIMLTPIIMVGLEDVYGYDDFYRNHDGKLITDDKFETRVVHCVELIFKNMLNMDEANCDTWVLTLEGESMIFEKILKDHDMYNVDGIKALLEAEKED